MAINPPWGGSFGGWVAPPSTDWVPGGYGDKRRRVIPTEVRAREAIINRLLPFLDPASRSAMMQQLAAENPWNFGGYAGTPTPPALSQAEAAVWNRQGRIQQALGALGTQQPRADTSQGINWLRGYLTTAMSGMPTQQTRQTRAQQATVASNLAVLEQQAENSPALAGYMELARNLVNPLQRTQSPSGGIGLGRATVKLPGSDVTRAGMRRNPWLT